MQDESAQEVPQDHGDAGDATLFELASLATPPVSTAFVPTADNGVASDAAVTALADDLEYTLTVGQALERIAAARRKTPSGRSIQRYCDEGHLAAKKIRTIFGSEWLINETSLAKFIEAEPIVTGDASDAIDSDISASASPAPQLINLQPLDTIESGDASAHFSNANEDRWDRLNYHSL